MGRLSNSREAAERTTRSILAKPAVTDDDVRRLDSVTDDAVETAREQLGGHFAMSGLIDSVASDHITIVEKFAAREDHDRVDDELLRLANFFNGLRGRPYVDRNLSRNPVQNRLLDRLHAGSGSCLFAVHHGPTNFATFAYPGSKLDFFDPVESGRNFAVPEAAFDGVATPERRRDVTVVMSYGVPPMGDLPGVVDRSNYERTPIHVQSYDDADAASAAIQALGSSTVRSDGTETLGGRTWHRIYYRHDGDVTYAYLVQAGEYVITVAPGDVAWEERSGWTGPLSRSWVWE